MFLDHQKVSAEEREKSINRLSFDNNHSDDDDVDDWAASIFRQRRASVKQHGNKFLLDKHL